MATTEFQTVSAEKFIECISGTENSHTITSDDNPNAFTLQNLIITGDVVISSIDEELNKRIIFSNCTFKGKLIIDGGTFNNRVYVGNCTFEDDCELRGGHFLKRVDFQKCDFFKKFYIAEVECEHIVYISRCFFYYRFRIFGGNLKQGLAIGNSAVNELIFYDKIDYEVRIKDGIVYRLFSNAVLRSGISIISTLIQIFELIEFRNFGEIFLTKIDARKELESRFCVINSDLGKTKFTDVLFHTYNTINIKASLLGEIQSIKNHLPLTSQIIQKCETDWNPTTGMHTCTKDCKNGNDHNFSTEVYNMLSQAMQKQGNRQQEGVYFTKFLELKQEQLKAKSNETKQSDSERIALWWHQVSTSFGTNWINGVSVLLISNLLGYLLFIYSLNLNNELDKIIALDHFRYYLQFLLPTHKPEFIDSVNINGLSILFDLIFRVINGFIIYQIITAFRRVGKR